MSFKRYNKLSDINRDWIDNYPKIINKNGCWIPNKKSGTGGYVSVEIEKLAFKLHRLSMCIYYNIDYNNQKVVARHGKECDNACFNPKHLKPGSNFDNEKDKIEYDRNFNLSKLVCSKCGGEYKTHIVKTGWSRGQTRRICPHCITMRNWVRTNVQKG